MILARALLVLPFLCGTTSAWAQVAADSLQVPAGALNVLEIPEENRPFAMIRAVRVLYSQPRRDPVPRPVAEFERLLNGLDRIRREMARTSTRTITLQMTATSESRDVLRAVLDAVGLRLREQRGTFTVEPLTSESDVDRRRLLLHAAIDGDAIARRLNQGETVSVGTPAIELPLPLPLETWATEVFEATIQPDTLFNAIIRSREASLLYYGTQAMTTETRAWLARTPGVLQWMRGRAGAVAGFGGAFRVAADGRVLVPGGAEAEDLWESLTEEKVTQPDRFARTLFGRESGRLAYFADALWTLDEPHVRFALGLWMRDPQMRRERFRALYSVFSQMDPAWSADELPFARPSYDGALLLSLLRLTDEGLLASPSYRKLWQRAVEGIELPAVDDRQLRDPAEDGIADAAWLAGLLVGKLPRERRVIIDRIAFGQRNFTDVADADLQQVLVAVRGYGRFPTAMLAVERAGVRQPAIFAAAARRAAALESVDLAAAVPLLAQFQGALALLERLARTGAVPQPALEQMVKSLIAIDFEDDRYRGRVAEWIRSQLAPALPPGRDSDGVDGRLLGALVDRLANPGARFSWEDQNVVLDTDRLRRDTRALREKQAANSLDTLLAVYDHTSALSGAPLTLADVKAHATGLAAAAARLSNARPWPDAPDAVPTVQKVVERTVKDLGGIRVEKDLARAPRIVRPLIDVLDYLLGETLVAFDYAASLGEAGRGLRSSVDISHRHVFGLATVGGNGGRLVPWRRPLRGGTGASGDAVTGSLLGIDLALSGTRLRRLTAEGLPQTPKLNGNDRETMTETVALLNPRAIDDAALEDIARGIDQGRQRVEKAIGGVESLEALAAEIRMSPSRRGLLAWSARHTSSAVLQLFSLGELFRLGGGQPGSIDPWGTAQDSLTGCWCVRFPDDSALDLAIGRADTGQLGVRLAELNLRVAVLLAELRVPATLFPHVMALATQDYVDSVPLVYGDDWAALAGRAWAISRERMEDYVAAVVASGPVRIVEEGGAR